MERKGLLKLLLLTCLVLVLLAVPMLVACGEEDTTDGGTTNGGSTTDGGNTDDNSDETFVYRFATGSPELDSSAINDVKAWAADVGEATDGRLTIEIYWGGALGESADALAMLDSGIADMVMEGYGYFSDTFPISDVITLPYLVTSTVACGTLMNSLLYDDLLPEYDNIKLLMFKPQDPIMLFLRDKPVTSLEDLDGLKIRTNTEGWTNVVEALGGTPVSVATADLYTSLETGVIDGLVTSLGFFYPMSMYEVCDYAIVNPMGMGMNFIAMSWEAWDRLPADLQLILEQVTLDAYWTNITHESDNYLNSYLLPVEEAGVELIYLTEEERDEWVAATASIVDDWVASMDAQGLAGSEAVRRARLLQEVLQ